MKKILVVDDDVNIQDYLERVLQDDYRLMRAFDGEEALGLLTTAGSQDLPDAILLDMDMPVMNGLIFLKRFAEHEFLKHIPVIVLTASDFSAVKLRLKDNQKFLNKPILQEDLLYILENLFRTRA